MTWLWEELHELFDTADNSFPEICICNLEKETVVSNYNLIRKHAKFMVGGPRFINYEAKAEMNLDDVEDASKLVVEKKAHPFHFMVRQIMFDDYYIPELGVFILDNAIALDYEKGSLWGPLEIESLLRLILKLMGKDSFLQFEELMSKSDQERILSALNKLSEQEELAKSA